MLTLLIMCVGLYFLSEAIGWGVINVFVLIALVMCAVVFGWRKLFELEEKRDE